MFRLKHLMISAAINLALGSLTMATAGDAVSYRTAELRDIGRLRSEDRAIDASGAPTAISNSKPMDGMTRSSHPDAGLRTCEAPK